MKIRSDFVTNSSSTSYVLLFRCLDELEKEYIDDRWALNVFGLLKGIIEKIRSGEIIESKNNNFTDDQNSMINKAYDDDMDMIAYRLGARNREINDIVESLCEAFPQYFRSFKTWKE